jgi:hypothetical protein
MRAPKMCVGIVASLVVLFAEACGGNAANASEIRTELDGMRFVSEGEFPLGSVTTAVAGEIVFGHYDLSFTREEVSWQYDDLCPTSLYQVDGYGNIESTDYFGNPIQGKYDRDSGRLLWDGAWYVPVP